MSGRSVEEGEEGEEGRVELCHNQLWGAIVDREWNLSKAAIACKERGFEPAGECVCTYVCLHECTYVSILPFYFFSFFYRVHAT